MKTSFRFLTPALGLAAALAIAPAAFAQDATDAAPTAAPQATSWNDVDVDGDGVISTEEAAAAPVLAEVHAQADANADGQLTGEEYRAFVAASQAEAAAGSTAADAGEAAYGDTAVEATGEVSADASGEVTGEAAEGDDIEQ